jgi:hypothetical protein
MAIRSVKYELEAKLTSSQGGLFSRPSGKLERKSYADMGERLKISIRNLKVPDKSTAGVTVDGVELARIQINNGSGRIDKEERDPDHFIKMQAGQYIEVKVDSVLLLRGQLYVD